MKIINSCCIPLLLFFTCILFLKQGAYAQVPFYSIDTSFWNSGLVMPYGFRSDILFTEGDVVVNSSGFKTVSKKNQSGLVFINSPVNDKNNIVQGKIVVSHDCDMASVSLGNGGGATYFDVKKVNDAWITAGYNYNIDFNNFGGISKNRCLIYTSGGRLLLSENASTLSKRHTTKIKSDSLYSSKLKHAKNWITEASLSKKQGIRKLTGFGNMSHEGLLEMPDSITFYLTEGEIPSLFFKFIAFSPKDLNTGQLFAYRQSNNGLSGAWMPIPMQIDSLYSVKEFALKAGATMFFNLRQLTLVNNQIYISERGINYFRPTLKKYFNAKVAYHLNQFKVNEEVYAYPFGGVLAFNPFTNEIRMIIQGGKPLADSASHFSNPDAILSATFRDKAFLIIHENIIEPSNRVSLSAATNNCIVNESYWYDLENGGSSILTRFLIAPQGGVIAGSSFTPDYQTLFLNIKHPDPLNNPPYNKSITLAITGFSDRLIREKRTRTKN